MNLIDCLSVNFRVHVML